MDETKPALPVKGRKKGSKNKMVAPRKKVKNVARALIEDRSPAIVKKVISLGLAGDVACLKMLMDRIVPQHKSVDVKTTKTDYAININVESLEGISPKAVDFIDAVQPELEEKDDEQQNQG